MTDLVHRAEEALLGAVLHNPSLLDDVPWLLPRHFDTPLHQQAFAAITDIHTLAPGLRGAQLADTVSAQLDLTDERTELTRWALASTSSSAAVYGRMIQEAALRRDLATHADRLTMAAAAGAGPEAEHQRLLGQALRGHSSAFTSDLTTAAEQMAEDLRALREEQVLADLIQHPEYGREVTPWLAEGVFTSSARRDVYRAIVRVELAGEPVEELTVAWEIARARSLEATLAGEAGLRAADGPSGLGQIQRLAELTVEPGSSVSLGRDLLADHTRAQIAVTSAEHSAAVRVDLVQQRTVTREATIDRLQPPGPQIGLNGREMRQ